MWARWKKELQERVASIFYSHGLFCASHPFAIISLVITIILMTSYPLTTLPLPGNAPLQYRTQLEGYKVPLSSLPVTREEDAADKRPRWYLGTPVAYILQVVVKATVSPWDPKKHIQTDAFRAPLAKAFDIVEHINNFQNKYTTEDGKKSMSLGDVCLHVFETVAPKKGKRLLPEYNCLAISPAHFWSNSKSMFDEDAKIVQTVTKSYGQLLDVPPSIRDLLFGVPMKDTGIRRYFLRNRQRVISYAVTVLFKTYDEKYITALREHLHHIYPLRLVANSTVEQHADHVYYKDVNYFVEYTPLLVAYAVVFLYLYFSVRKIEMVKSKWGLALSAVVTVVSSLLMSIGICTLFGMTPSLNGSEIFPYLVVIVGLENVLVVTKSVVSTPVHLDVKMRVAMGLQDEGWSIVKNLMTELLILAVGFFTFVPAIQEFSLFAVVGLLSDFFLQMFFFTTVLSIDIRRMELADLQKQSILQSLGGTASDLPSGRKTGEQGLPAKSHYYQKPCRPHNKNCKGSRVMSTSRGYFTDEFSTLDPIRKAPKRVQFMNYWARSRFMQRMIMVCVVIWSGLIVYKAGLVEHLAEVALRNASEKHHSHGTDRDTHDNSDMRAHTSSHASHAETQVTHGGGEKYVHGLLTHHTPEKWRELSYNHWPTLLSYYNITTRGRYITMLPSIHLSLVINGDDTVSMRNPEEAATISDLTKQYVGSDGHDPEFVIQDSSATPTKKDHSNSYTLAPDRPREDHPYHPALNLTLVISRIFREPQSRTELITTILLGVASFILFTYCMTTLYRCMCSRKYDKWRAKRDKDRRSRRYTSPYYKQIRETVPLVLESHLQEVECLVTDGPLIVSACLGGQLCIWDSMSGECITSISRRRDPPFELRSPAVGSSVNVSAQDLREPPLGMPQLVPPAEPSPGPTTLTPPSTTPTSPPVTASASGGGDGPGVRYVPATRPPTHTRHRSEDFGHRRNYSADFNMMQQLQQQMPFQTIQQQYERQQQHQQQERQHRQKEAQSLQQKAVGTPMQSVADTMPDLTGTIDSDFQSIARPTSQSQPSLHNNGDDGPRSSSPSQPEPGGSEKGFDFSRFDVYYDEHRQLTAEKVAYMALRHPPPVSYKSVNSSCLQQPLGTPEGGRTRSLSQGDCPDPLPADGVLFDRDIHDDLPPAVWCIACQDSLIVTGCRNGRIEFWDGLTGALKFVHQDGSSAVTAICLVDHKLIAARLNGVVDFLELETSRTPTVSDISTLYSLHSRTIPSQRRQTGSGDSSFCADYKSWEDVIHIKMIDSVCAHQRPITILQSEGGRVVTASQDHTLKVYRVEDSLRLYTLHGHTGGITALFLDKVAPLAAASGAEDGVVRLWDLMTGACVHKLRGHAATVTSVICTSLYVISVGMDDQLCIWERCKGHLLHYIPSEPGYCNTVSMLTSNLMVTGGQGCLHLWDISKGEVLRAVTLGDSNPSVFIKHINVIGNSTVVCDYGNQLRVIHFLAVLEKAD